MTQYLMEIKPALEVIKRHQLEDSLKGLGYHVSGGGQMVDGSVCDISFDDGIEPEEVSV